MSIKLCECGCGCTDPIAQRTNRKYGYVKGQPHRFLVGHFSRTSEFKRVMATVPVSLTVHAGTENGNWKGGRRLDAAGYVLVRMNGIEVYEHRVVAERSIGRPLGEKEVVHHRNGDRADNRPENLEVLPSQSAHMKIHMTSEEACRRGQGNRGRAALLASLASGT